jgi:hypothetical protein
MVVRSEAVIHDGESYCPECSRNHFFLSIHDRRQRYHRSRLVEDSYGNFLLSSLLEGDPPEYVRCEASGHFVPHVDAVFRENKYYHPSHVPVRHKVHRYSHKPEPIFHGSKHDHLKIGLELEIERGGYDNRVCDKILEIVHPEGVIDADSIMYGKTDSSINNGFEIVTHPCTFAFHMQNIPWGALLQKAEELSFNPNPTSCGLHLHLSRRYWGQSETRQDVGIMKLLFLVERYWDKLLKFSRRTQEQVDRWASRYGMRNTPKEILDYAKSGQGRYKAVNLENPHTVELRLFRGTLDPKVLRATIQLCFVLAQVSKGTTVEGIVALTWNDLCEKFHDHSELWDYLGDLGLQRELSREEQRVADDQYLVSQIVNSVIPAPAYF